MSVAYSLDHRDTYELSLNPKGRWELEFEKYTETGIWIIQINVKQTRVAVDDVIFYLFDDENHKIWVNNNQAIAAGASASRLPMPTFRQHGKVATAAISFRPKPKTQFIFVLDNTHSVYQHKGITVNVYWVWTDSPLRNYVKSILEKLDWDEIWQFLQNDNNEFEEGKLP